MSCVLVGKKRRLTLLECGNDLNTMLDVAKIADLVLLLVDASFGFEMETFEFLNILQVYTTPSPSLSPLISPSLSPLSSLHLPISLTSHLYLCVLRFMGFPR